MKIEDEFRVDVPIDEAWKVLLDVERIAPCMPGAQLQEIEGDEYRGIVKIKVGPITAQYKGAARIVETDENAHQVVLKAEGRDTRGQGNASATVTATLTPAGSGTVVHIDTDLNITGKVAQFGRGVMADVSSKLLGQFASNLERDVLSGNGTDAAASTASASDRFRVDRFRVDDLVGAADLRRPRTGLGQLADGRLGSRRVVGTGVVGGVGSGRRRAPHRFARAGAGRPARHRRQRGGEARRARDRRDRRAAHPAVAAQAPQAQEAAAGLVAATPPSTRT